MNKRKEKYSNLKNSETFLQNKKKKRKILKFKEICFLDSLSD